jgi:hypothetical protein
LIKLNSQPRNESKCHASCLSSMSDQWRRFQCIVQVAMTTNWKNSFVESETMKQIARLRKRLCASRRELG